MGEIIGVFMGFSWAISKMDSWDFNGQNYGRINGIFMGEIMGVLMGFSWAKS